MRISIYFKSFSHNKYIYEIINTGAEKISLGINNSQKKSAGF